MSNIKSILSFRVKNQYLLELLKIKLAILCENLLNFFGGRLNDDWYKISIDLT